LVAAVVLAFLYFRPASADVFPVRFAVPLPAKVAVNSFDTAALSPDGRHLAFTAAVNAGSGGSTGPGGGNMLLIRSMDSLEARRIPGTDGALLPFWSPDSRVIGFSAAGKTKKVGIDGSPAVTLWDSVSFGGAWNRKGVILIGR